ncbi:TPA: helix-turn-helix transcriptional regulator [Salmonella enterica subsp. enterica serovar Typhi str. AG3]|nr:helix-turn-helix transcriptional regulator [Salmonella enterica subsp. enterica serovar Typhi str. AG3]
MDTMKKIGFSLGDTVRLLWLQKALTQAVNPKQLHDDYESLFPGRNVSYDYVARIAKKLEVEGALVMHMEKHRKFYSTTQAGREKLKHYEDLYKGKFHEIVKVLDRMHYFISKRGTKPELPEEQLPQEFRGYFAKLISVKDAMRHMIFTLGKNRTEFYIAEVNEQMEMLFGWSSSNGYLYEIAREMEHEGSIRGRWKDSERRTVRLIHITPDGEDFAERIAADLIHQIENVRKYLKSFITFFS